MFTLSNCPQFTSVLGALCSAHTCQTSANERLGLVSRKRSVAGGEKPSIAMYHLIKMKSKAFLPHLAFIEHACCFLNIPTHPHTVWFHPAPRMWYLTLCRFRLHFEGWCRKALVWASLNDAIVTNSLTFDQVSEMCFMWTGLNDYMLTSPNVSWDWLQPPMTLQRMNG